MNKDYKEYWLQKHWSGQYNCLEEPLEPSIHVIEIKSYEQKCEDFDIQNIMLKTQMKINMSLCIEIKDLESKLAIAVEALEAVAPHLGNGTSTPYFLHNALASIKGDIDG